MIGVERAAVSGRTRAGLSLLVVAAGLAGGAIWMPQALAAQAITSAGPLTHVGATTTLNCSVNHAADLDGEFFGDTACGTFIAVGGKVYGPPDVPAGGSVTGDPNFVAFVPVSQSGVTGAGTAANPFRIVTVVDAGSTGVRITQTDSCVVGHESYRSDVAVANTSGAAVAPIVYRAGDCYFQNSDDGYGAVDAPTGAVACVGVAPAGGPGTRIEQWMPLTPGSRYIEAYYSTVWAAIATRTPFPNTCECGTLTDNGGGLSWSLSLAAGASATVSHLTSFSPAGNRPLTTAKTADAASVPAGGTTGYTITVTNPTRAPSPSTRSPTCCRPGSRTGPERPAASRTPTRLSPASN